MLKVSAVIITLNEENNIGRCIEALENVVDEIIVVDALSSDKTKEICLQHNVKFHECKWKGFAEQKNYANSLATNDLILSVDADEVLSEKLQNSILIVKQNDSYAKGFVFTMAMLPFYRGKWIRHSGLHPDYKKRLWNRNDAQWSGLIHETLSFNKPVKKIQLKGNLLHYISDSDIFNKTKSDKYAALQAQQMFTKGKKSSAFKIAYKTLWAFAFTFFCRLGFLDGKIGYEIAVNKAQYTKLKYQLLRKLNSEAD